MTEILIIAICLILNAVFSATEMAFVSVPIHELKKLAKTGHRAAEKLLLLRKNPERTLSVVQVGITLVGALSAATGGLSVGGEFATELAQDFEISLASARLLSVALVIIPLSYINIIIGELVPKTLILNHPLAFALKSAMILSSIEKVFSPIVSILERSTQNFIKLFVPKRYHPSPKSDSLEDVIDIGTLTSPHRQYVLNLVSLESKRIRDVMIPWKDVTKIKDTCSVDEIQKTIFNEGHTRIPVKDHEGTVIGLLHAKELVSLLSQGIFDWKSIIRPILKIPENESLLKVLQQLQRAKSQLCIVGSAEEPLGIVTIEDIIEEVVGDLNDEDDDGYVKRLIAFHARVRSLKEKP